MKDAQGALYRKYRPASFSDVVGQEHITDALARSVKENTIVHAYLFSGPRGIGKTSVARIFAYALGTTDNDITEIDAASNRRIDDARELRETVNSLPFDSPYKVYIIDEVHMLTKEAFNALLKTLEEPPSHVIFILATTESHKLPDTIISRCQMFTFRRPATAIVKEHLISIAKKEGVTLEPAAAHLLALLADGSFRDALGGLQRVISALDSTKIGAEDVEKVTGAPSTQLVTQFIEAIAEMDREKGLSALGSVAAENMDAELFLERVLYTIRFILLFRFAPDQREQLQSELSEDELSFVEKIAQNTKFSFTSRELKEFLDARSLMGVSHVPHFPLETAFLDIITRAEKAEA